MLMVAIARWTSFPDPRPEAARVALNPRLDPEPPVMVWSVGRRLPAPEPAQRLCHMAARDPVLCTVISSDLAASSPSFSFKTYASAASRRKFFLSERVLLDASVLVAY